MHSGTASKKRISMHAALVPAVFIAVQVAILAIVLGGLEVTNLTRAYVAGEGQYSKAQKAAVHALSEFVRTGHPGDWASYEWQIKIPRGTRMAREALERRPVDTETAARGLIQGFNHPDDVPGMIWLFRHFSESRLMRDQVDLWRYGDQNIEAIEALAVQIKEEMDGARNPQRLEDLLNRVDHLDAELTVYEHAFSAAMRRSASELHSMVYWGGGGASLLLWTAALWLWSLNARRMAAARAELQASERRFRDVAETAGDWIWETDAQLRFTYLSERLEQVAGIGRGDVMGKNRLELARKGADALLWRRHAEDLEKRRPFRDFGFVFHAPDGRELRFLVSGRPVFDEKGRFTGYRGTGRDATKEIEAQRRLSEQHRILQATLENMSQGISVIDADMNLIAYNRRFRELLEFPEQDLKLGDPFEKFIRYNAARGEYGNGDVEELVRKRLALAKRGEPHSFTRARPDGTVLQVQGAPLPGGGCVTVYSDITEQERSKLELCKAVDTAEQASQAKSFFLANMSHELRTPLNAIIGFSDLMRQEILGPLGTPAYYEYLDDIKASGHHLLDVIADILDLSRIEAGRLAIDEEQVDLGAVVQDALRLLSQEAKEAGVEIAAEVEPDISPILGDRKRLCQIMVNLVGNAVKFSPEGSEVQLRVSTMVSGEIEIEVADRGPGILAADIPTILEPFRQAEATVANNKSGAGLGLPLVKRLVELHGGTLVIDSGPQEGTRAFARLPAARVCTAAETRKASTA